MVFGFGKSDEEKIKEFYSNFIFDVIDLLKISTYSKYSDALQNFVNQFLDVYVNDGKLVFDVYPFVSAHNLRFFIEDVSNRKNLSQKEKEDFTDAVICYMSIFFEMWNEQIPKTRISKIDFSNVKLNKNELYEDFGTSTNFSIFKKKIFSKEVYGYYVLYHILEVSDTKIHLENFLKKYNSIKHVSENELNLLNDLLSHEIPRNTSSVPMLGSSYVVDMSSFKLPLFALKNTYSFEYKVNYKNYLKQKILDFHNPETIEDYIDAFLELTGKKSYSFLYLLVQILREEKIIWKGNFLGKVVHRYKLAEISSFKRHLSDDSIPDVNSMTGLEFEHFLGNLFDKMGYSVEVTKASGDQGADLILRKKDEVVAVQAKQYSDNVTNSAVQQITGSLKFYNATRGMVVTTSNFTKSAFELALSNNVELINGEKLDQLITKYW